MLYVLTIKIKLNKINGHKETFEGDGFFYYFDCGDSIMGALIGPNSSNCRY